MKIEAKGFTPINTQKWLKILHINLKFEKSQKSYYINTRETKQI